MLLENYYRYLAYLFDRRSESLKDVTGTSRTINPALYTKGGKGTYSYSVSAAMEVDSPEGNIDFGIVVGTSDIPVSPYDYYINKISHGTSSGQLYYYSTQVKDVVVSGNIIELEVARSLSNQTDEDINVNEFGLIAKIKGYYFLIAREVSPATVPSGGFLEVSFKFKTTV
ncbi:MAG: hypothetical protein DRP01_01295 [Archaeoglobales archaeon]|nr:MAG: hypothetical protein DRP01_01295 [Archaeoglobales archaeon]